MSEAVWEFAHSVECAVPREVAWAYWTNAENWDDPPARFEFDGPFAVGTRLKTILPRQELESVIRQVVEGHSARIEMDVMSAVLAFDWRFEELDGKRTKITQSIRLSGGGAAAMVEQAKMLEHGVPQGMQKLAGNMERNWAGPGTQEKRETQDPS
jgi:Polyketide cyclase / dehydrase and lipid transport.